MTSESLASASSTISKTTSGAGLRLRDVAAFASDAVTLTVDRTEAYIREKFAHQHLRGGLVLVRSHGNLRALRLDVGEKFRNAGIGLRIVGKMDIVVGAEIVQKRLGKVLRAFRKCTFHQFSYAVPDKLIVLLKLMSPEPVKFQCVVSRSGQVSDGIYQSAVEVEYEKSVSYIHSMRPRRL